MGIMISIGKWGGVYVAWKGHWSKRICLGWISMTFFPVDGDEIINMASRYAGTIK